MPCLHSKLISNNFNLIIFYVILLLSLIKVSAQSDTLIFNNGQVIAGKIKKMEKGVLEFDTDYADDEFKIKWLSIENIISMHKYRIGVKNDIFKGQLEVTKDKLLRVYEKDSTLITCNLKDVVYITELKESFSDRFSAEFEVGFNLTKAQNLQQFSIRSAVGYKTDKSTATMSFNMLQSSQDNADDVFRRDGLLSYSRILFNKWYGVASLSTLSNSEQNLEIRANTQIGLGRYLFANYKADWGVKIGVNNNLERFTNMEDSRNTWEAYLGTKLDLFNFDGFDLSFLFTGYSGLSDTSRYRADTNLDLKYDLPLDFFVRLGFSLNYDNRPALNASETDYILRTGIGWEW